MTPNDSRPLARLHGEPGVLAAVPALLGFHPEESIVLVCLTAPRSQVGPVLRMDIDEPNSDDLMVQTARRKADAVAVVLYSAHESERPAHIARMRQLYWRLRKTRRPVVTAMLVYGDRAFRLPTDGGEPESWIPVPGPDSPASAAMAAVNAFSGRRVLPTRSALATSIAGPTGADLQAAENAADRAGERLAMLIEQWTADDPPATELAHRLAGYAEVLLEAARRSVDETGQVAADVACALAILLEHNTVRDVVLTEILIAGVEADESFLPALLAAARVVPDSCGPHLFSLLAMCAYRHGEGALAQVAVDRALLVDPENRLARLLLGGMSQGLDPELLVELGNELKTQRVG